MRYYYQSFVLWCGDVLHNIWVWLDRLDRTEWLMLLGVTTAIGFLCMRGYGSRTGC